MVRKVLGVVAGVVVVGAVVSTLLWVSGLFYPLPEGLDASDPSQAERLAEHVAGLPFAAWALGFSSELVGAFFGGLVAATVAGASKRVVSGFVVAVALVFSIMNWVAFAHPIWFVLGQLVGYPLVLLAVWRVLGESTATASGVEGAVSDPT